MRGVDRGLRALGRVPVERIVDVPDELREVEGKGGTHPGLPGSERVARRLGFLPEPLVELPVSDPGAEPVVPALERGRRPPEVVELDAL